MIAHALVGGLASEAAGGDFAAGAAAGLSSALAAHAGVFKGMSEAEIANASQLIGAAAALLAGGDGQSVNQGAATAQSAAINNYLTHDEQIQKLTAQAELAKCNSGAETCDAAKVAALQSEVSRLSALDHLRDAQLLSTCRSGNKVACVRQLGYAAKASEGYYFSQDRDQVDLSPDFLAGIQASWAALSEKYHAADAVAQGRAAQELDGVLNGLGFGALGGVAVAGGYVVASEAIPAAISCASNPACWSEVGIAFSEAAAGDALGPTTLSMTVATGGRLALQKGDDVIEIIDDALGRLTRVADDATTAIPTFRATDGSVYRVSGTGELVGANSLIRPKNVPSNWVSQPAKGNGTIYYNPNNRQDFIRVMEGEPSSPFPSQRQTYVINSRSGQIVDMNGNPVASNDPAAHIPLSDFEFLR